MMAKAIIPILKDFKQQINNTNDRLNRQYWMMTRAHERYNRLFRQTHKTFQIHHLAICQIQISTRQHFNRNRTFEFWLSDTPYIRSQDFS